MRIYIATPINARKGKNMREKLAAAKHRIEMLKEILSEDEQFSDCEFLSTFDVPHSANATEARILGNCVTAIINLDGIYLDHNWQNSKGCQLEYRAAKIYGKMIFEHDKL